MSLLRPSDTRNTHSSSRSTNTLFFSYKGSSSNDFPPSRVSCGMLLDRSSTLALASSSLFAPLCPSKVPSAPFSLTAALPPIPLSSCPLMLSSGMLSLPGTTSKYLGRRRCPGGSCRTTTSFSKARFWGSVKMCRSSSRMDSLYNRERRAGSVQSGAEAWGRQ